MSDWNDETIEELKRLHALGNLSVKEIALEMSQKFGVAFSKSKIMGKMHRLGLKNRNERTGLIHSRRVAEGRRKNHNPNKVKPRAVLPVRTTKEIELEFNAAGGSVGIDMMELKKDLCRWPLGSMTDQPPYQYCGRKTDGTSYCAHHHRRSKRVWESKPSFGTTSSRAKRGPGT